MKHFTLKQFLLISFSFCLLIFSLCLFNYKKYDGKVVGSITTSKPYIIRNESSKYIDIEYTYIDLKGNKQFVRQERENIYYLENTKKGKEIANN